MNRKQGIKCLTIWVVLILTIKVCLLLVNRTYGADGWELWTNSYGVIMWTNTMHPIWWAKTTTVSGELQRVEGWARSTNYWSNDVFIAGGTISTQLTCRVVLAGGDVTNPVVVTRLPTNIEVQVLSVGGDTNPPVISQLRVGLAVSEWYTNQYKEEWRGSAAASVWGNASGDTNSSWQRWGQGIATSMGLTNATGFTNMMMFEPGEDPEVFTNLFATGLGKKVFAPRMYWSGSWGWHLSGLMLTSTVERTSWGKRVCHHMGVVFATLAGASMLWVATMWGVNHLQTTNLNITTNQTALGTNVNAGTQKLISGAIALAIAALMGVVGAKYGTTYISQFLRNSYLADYVAPGGTTFIWSFIGSGGWLDIGEMTGIVLANLSAALIIAISAFAGRKLIEVMGV